MFSAVASKGCRTPDVNLRPPVISEAITAEMLKLKTQLDMVKYLLRVYFFPLGSV